MTLAEEKQVLTTQQVFDELLIIKNKDSDEKTLSNGMIIKTWLRRNSKLFSDFQMKELGIKQKPRFRPY